MRTHDFIYSVSFLTAYHVPDTVVDLVAKSHPTLCDPVDYSPPGSSVGFLRQESWSQLPFPSAEEPPDPGMEPTSPA